MKNLSSDGQSFEIVDTPYSDIYEFVDQIGAPIPVAYKRKKIDRRFNKTEYINFPCAFDIETSSFMYNGQKVGLCYLWQFGINGRVIYGRTWDELYDLITAIIRFFGLSQERRLVVYIHNLPFEFQFIKDRFEWKEVFALDVRDPLYALTTSGIEFRCSYKLSGYSLADLGDKLLTYKVKKQTGLLDYDLIRHPETPLTTDEIKYAIYDVLVVMAYIREKMDMDGDIAKLQYTKTGYVRKYCREMCFKGGKDKSDKWAFYRYRQIMDQLTLTPDEYEQMKRAFQGGFTHANALYVDKVVDNVDSFDYTSSYPYVMVSEKFPMSAGRLLSYEEWHGKLSFYLNHYCCIFDVEFKNIRPRIWYDNIISSSKCYRIEGNRVINNGRVVSADLIRTTVTDIDFRSIHNFYEWDEMNIANFRIYERGYLPKSFIMAILKLYGDKTQLKGVEDRQTDYLNSKEMLNSCYGMTVTDIVRSTITYKKEWTTAAPDLNAAIDKYNKSKNRFLFYAWGLFVTAYARYNLFEGIREFGDDYIYADTDSIKAQNAEKHMTFINDYNERVRAKLEKTAAFYNIPFELFEPVTIKGKKKLLGVWEHETVDHKYEKFKTLGAKRYMIKGDKVLLDERTGKHYDLSITVAGVNKFHVVPWLIDKYGIDGAFDAFFAEDDKGLDVPPEHTGKLTHTYIDEPRDGVITDYTGQSYEFHELSCVHLEPAEYSMSKSKEFLKFLYGYKDIER